MVRILMVAGITLLAGCSSGPVPEPADDGAITSSMAPQPDAPPKERRVTLSIRKGTLPKVLEALARLTDMNFISDAGVQGTVTMSVSDRPAGEVLEAVARTFHVKVLYLKDNLVRLVPQ